MGREKGMQHTLKPWHFEEFDNGTSWIMDADGKYLFEVVCEDECKIMADREHLKGNMTLAAASPDLLEGLEIAEAMLIKLTDGNSPLPFLVGLIKIQEALAKAKGKSL